MIGSVFGVEERALKVCEDRASLLAANIANSSTPKYKARDIDFQQAMKQASTNQALSTTHTGHLTGSNTTGDGQKVGYRVPMQSTVDENTVDDEIERKNFIQNAITYQAGLGFAKNSMSTLLHAIRGE